MTPADSIAIFPSPLPRPDASEGDEALRRAYLSREGTVRTFGTLLLVVGVLSIAQGLLMISLGSFVLTAEADLTAGLPRLLQGGALLGFGVYEVITGPGLRRLDPRYRAPAIVLCGLHLLFALGSVSETPSVLMGLCGVYLLGSKPGEMVFTERYAEARRATPHIVYHPSRAASGLVFLALTAVSLAVWLGLGS